MADRGFKIKGYGEAEEIVRRGLERGEIYMRGLVSFVTGDGAYADGLDYSGLLRQTRRILGVATKMLEGRDRNRGIEIRTEDADGKITEIQGELF